MHPHSIRPRFLFPLLAGLLVAPVLHAQQQDAAPVDIKQLLDSLRTIREQQTTQLKAQKQSAQQQLAAVANSPERAIAFWEEAVRATQFDGMAKEGAQFRAWKESEGEALKERVVANAVHLHLTWLALTLQHSSGVLNKDLLPAVINYTKELMGDEAAMEVINDNIKQQRDAAAIAPPGGGNRRTQPQARKLTDAEIKRAHDSILKRNLAASPVVKWLNLTDMIGGGGQQQGRNQQGRNQQAQAAPEAPGGQRWERDPSDYDGIFTNIILPELRAQKDSRALEYWDLKLKKEADIATRSKLAYEVEKFNTQRRPELLWSRAEEVALLGLKNRAIGEMFTLIKTYPTHPSAREWIASLEQMLVPTPPESASAATTPAAPATP